MNQRTLSKYLAGLALWICFVPAQAALSPIGPEYRVGGFVLGCQAYTFHRFTAFEAMEQTAAAGGKTIEFYPGQNLSPEDRQATVDVGASEETIEKIKAKAKQHGLLIVNFGVVGIPRDEPGARRVFEFARKLGVRAITIEPSADQIELIDKLIKEYNIAAGIHCHPKRANNPDAGDLPLGLGVTNVKGVLRELRRQKFDGNISIEYERSWEHSVEDVAQCVGYVRGFADGDRSE